MLNRRILRVKAFQNLYAYEQCKTSNHNLARDFIKESFLPDLNSMEVQDKAELNREAQIALEIFEKNRNNIDAIENAEASPKIKRAVKEAIAQYRNANLRDREFLLKNMITSAERIPQLYLLAIELIQAFADHVGKEYERKRKLAGRQAVGFSSELNLHRNKILEKLRNSPAYQAALAKNNVNLDDIELEIKEWFREYVKPTEEYQTYISTEQPTTEQDAEIVEAILKKILFKNEVILNYFAEKDLNWTENKAVVRSLAAKVIKNVLNSEVSDLPEIAMNWEEDKEFFQNIFNFTIEKDAKNRELIAQKTKNWDIDRLAFTDKVIISMALTEMQQFPSIPVKVSINEYIDISKTYSTPKSKQFVNGLLDVMSKELTEKGKIRKSGRGLLDNK